MLKSSAGLSPLDKSDSVAVQISYLNVINLFKIHSLKFKFHYIDIFDGIKTLYRKEAIHTLPETPCPKITSNHIRLSWSWTSEFRVYKSLNITRLSPNCHLTSNCVLYESQWLQTSNRCGAVVLCGIVYCMRVTSNSLLWRRGSRQSCSLLSWCGCLLLSLPGERVNQGHTLTLKLEGCKCNCSLTSLGKGSKKNSYKAVSTSCHIWGYFAIL